MDVMTSKGLSAAKVTKLRKGSFGVFVIVHFERSNKRFAKWIHGASILKIYSASDPGDKGLPTTQETTAVTLHRALADICKQAEHEEK